VIGSIRRSERALNIDWISKRNRQDHSVSKYTLIVNMASVACF